MEKQEHVAHCKKVAAEEQTVCGTNCLLLPTQRRTLSTAPTGVTVALLTGRVRCLLVGLLSVVKRCQNSYYNLLEEVSIQLL